MSSAWLPQSAYEWMASASIADEPVKAAPPVFATAIARLAPRAKKIDLSESAWVDMVSAGHGKRRARRAPGGIPRRSRRRAPAPCGTGDRATAARRAVAAGNR